MKEFDNTTIMQVRDDINLLLYNLPIHIGYMKIVNEIAEALKDED